MLLRDGFVLFVILVVLVKYVWIFYCCCLFVLLICDVYEIIYFLIVESFFEWLRDDFVLRLVWLLGCFN